MEKDLATTEPYKRYGSSRLAHNTTGILPKTNGLLQGKTQKQIPQNNEKKKCPIIFYVFLDSKNISKIKFTICKCTNRILQVYKTIFKKV